MTHAVELVKEVFNTLFTDTYNTVLQEASGRDPIYLPADEQEPYNRILYANGFVASALHEISHWCVAGDARRRLVDYGYWYKPDGRSMHEQVQFELAEQKPQAIEWIFAQALGLPFFVSADNTTQRCLSLDPFRCKVREQALRYLDHGLPPRAGLFLNTLLQRQGQEQKFLTFWKSVASEGILPG